MWHLTHVVALFAVAANQGALGTYVMHEGDDPLPPKYLVTEQPDLPLDGGGKLIARVP